MRYRVADLFARQGGLSVGFASFDNGKRLGFAVSAEMDEAADRRLTLRSWLRHAKPTRKKKDLGPY